MMASFLLFLMLLLPYIVLGECDTGIATETENAFGRPNVGVRVYTQSICMCAWCMLVSTDKILYRANRFDEHPSLCAGGQEERVRLDDVSEFYSELGKMTAGRKSSRVPQVHVYV